MDSSVKQTVPVARYSYYALGVLTLVNFLNYIDRQVLPAVAPVMQRDLGLTDTEIGAMEASLLLSFTVLAPLFGWLGDRYSRTKLMAAAAVVWSVATGVIAWLDKLPLRLPSMHLQVPLFGIVGLSGLAAGLCSVRAVVGIGESSYSTITPALIADYFPIERRATALGVFQAAIPMGFTLGFVLGALLAHFFGWRIPFLLVGLPGLFLAAVVWSLREPKRGEHDAVGSRDQESAPTSWWQTTKKVFTTPDWLLSTTGYTAVTFVLGAFATWATLMLAREKNMGPTAAAVVLGVVTLFAGATGTFGGGWVADRVAAKRRNGYYLVCAISSLLAVVPAFLALIMHAPTIFLPAIFIAVALLFVNNAPFHAILVNSVPPAIRATAVALNIVVIHVCGDVISRFGVGTLSDAIAAGHIGFIHRLAGWVGLDPVHEHLTSALLVVPLALFISAFFFFWGAQRDSRSAKTS